MITQAYLAKVLVRMEEAFDEESGIRRLTDWRQKGLLPPLKEKGQQHHGKIYYWNNPEIVAQAVTISRLFGLRSRIEWVMLSAWFLGYDLPLHKVREIWLSNLEVEINDLNKAIRPNEKMVDVISRELDGKIYRKKKKPNLISKSEFFISLFTNTFCNPEFDFDDLGDESDIEELCLLICPTSSTDGKNIIDVIYAKAISNFLNKHLSLMARYELIKHYSDESLREAQLNWRKAQTTLRWFYRVISPDPSKLNKEEFQFQLFISSSFIMINLILINLEKGSEIAELLEELNKFTTSTNIDEMKGILSNKTDVSNDERFYRLKTRLGSILESILVDISKELLIENPRM